MPGRPIAVDVQHLVGAENLVTPCDGAGTPVGRRRAGLVGVCGRPPRTCRDAACGRALIQRSVWAVGVEAAHEAQRCIARVSGRNEMRVSGSEPLGAVVEAMSRLLACWVTQASVGWR